MASDAGHLRPRAWPTRLGRGEVPRPHEEDSSTRSSPAAAASAPSSSSGRPASPAASRNLPGRPRARGRASPASVACTSSWRRCTRPGQVPGKKKLAAGKIRPVRGLPRADHRGDRRGGRHRRDDGGRAVPEGAGQRSGRDPGRPGHRPGDVRRPPLAAGSRPASPGTRPARWTRGSMMTVPGEATGSLGFIALPPDHFVAGSTKEGTYCTPRSVAAVPLYENDSPYRTVMPSGVIDTSEAGLRGHRGRAGQGGGQRVRGGREVHRQAGGRALRGLPGDHLLRGPRPDDHAPRHRVAGADPGQCRTQPAPAGHREGRVHRPVPRLRDQRRDGGGRAGQAAPQPRARPY